MEAQTFSHSNVDATNPKEALSRSFPFNNAERDFKPEPGSLVFCETINLVSYIVPDFLGII